MKQDVDILFANEAEVTSLYEENSFEAAAERARADVALAALTRSEAGSVILRGAETVEIAAEPTAWWTRPGREMPMPRGSSPV